MEYKFLEGLMWRGEYRYDWSDKDFFLTGAGTCPGVGGVGPLTPSRKLPSRFWFGQQQAPTDTHFRCDRFLRPEAIVTRS